MPSPASLLPQFNLQAGLLNLPDTPGLCRPLALAGRLQSLCALANWQLSQSAAAPAGLSRLAQHSFIFTCYQILSSAVALECWRQFSALCQTQGHIVIDNLTGLLAPRPEFGPQAAPISARLLPTPADQELAQAIYQLTSALLHSYPHLRPEEDRLASLWRDLNGHWQQLGPWPLSRFTTGLERLLTAWLQSYIVGEI